MEDKSHRKSTPAIYGVWSQESDQPSVEPPGVQACGLDTLEYPQLPITPCPHLTCHERVEAFDWD